MSRERKTAIGEAQQLSILPKGWCWANLNHLMCKIVDGTHHTPEYTEEGVPFISVKDIRDGSIHFDDCKYISADAHLLLIKRCHPQHGDILVTKSGTIGRIAIVKTERPFSLFVSVALLKRAHEQLDSRWIALAFENWMRSINVANDVKGSTIKNLHLEDFKSLSVPFAPLNEQRRIVSKIEELFSDLDAGVAALERIRANLKRYRAAVLKAAVEGKLTEEWRAKHPKAEPASKLLDRILAERRRKWEENQLAKFAAADTTPPKGWRERYVEPAAPDTTTLPELPQGWCWATVEQVNSAERPISYGVLQPGNDLDGGIPLVRVCDVADGKVAIDQLKRISPSISENYRRTIIQGGEVLLTVVGTIGRTAVAPVELAGANTARAVAVIPVVAPHNSYFLELTLRESSMRAKLTLAAHEVARKTLNLEDVRVAVVPIAPLEEQAEILKIVAEKLSQIEAGGTSVEQNLKRAARLRQSILKRAFEGKLVPQDPTDEPADKLLERIREQQAATNGSVAPRTRQRRASRQQEVETHGAPP